ncbi:MAG: TetR/AcrR family transcriptional regulator [Nevskiales bacterium]
MSAAQMGSTRQKRALKIPSPHRKGNIKVPYDGWLECARVVLIEEGIGMVKIDRLAKRLKVTRGGFYYHFENSRALLEALLKLWRTSNRFTPTNPHLPTPQAALETLDAVADTIIHERGFDPQFDMAVREWARISTPVEAVVREVDEERIRTMRKIFQAIGCRPKEAEIRARVFYYHQVGQYALGIRETTRTREKKLPIYLSVLCGASYDKAKAGASGRAPGELRKNGEHWRRYARHTAPPAVVNETVSP